MTRTTFILFYMEERKSNSTRIYALISRAKRHRSQKKRSNEPSQQHEKLVCWCDRRFSTENTVMGDFDLKKIVGEEMVMEKIIFTPIASRS